MEMLVVVINSVIFQIFIKHLQLPDPVLGGKNTVGTLIWLTILQRLKALLLLLFFVAKEEMQK